MAPILRLDEIRGTLTARVENGTLELTEGLFESHLIQSTFSQLKALPIALNNFSISSSDAEVVISGSADVLDAQQVQLTMSFSEVDGELRLETHAKLPEGQRWKIVEGLSLGAEEAEYLLIPDPEIPVVRSYLTCTLVAGSGSSVRMPVRVQIPTSENSWSLRGALPDMGTVTAEGLKALTGDQDFLTILPGGLSDPSHYSIDDFQVVFDPSTPECSFIGLVIAFHADWTFFEDSFRVDEIDLHLNLFNPLVAGRGPMLQGEVVGEMHIGNVPIEVGATFPDPVVYARLAETGSIDLLEVFRFFHVDPPAEFPSIEITQLEFDLFLDSLSGDFRLAVEKPIALAGGAVEFDRLFAELEWERDAEKQTSSVHGQLQADLQLGSTKLALSADYMSADSSLRFVGKAQDLALGQLIADLATKFGVDNELPALLEGLHVDDLNVVYDSGSKSFHFDMQVEIELASGKVELALSIDVAQSTQGYSKSISGQVLLGGQEFDVAFSDNETSTRLVGSYLHGAEQKPIQLKNLIAEVSAELANSVPEGLEFDLSDAVLVVQKSKSEGNAQNSETKLLFAFDMGLGLDLSELPLVGDSVPKEESLRVVLQPLVASAGFTEAEISEISTALPAQGTQLPKNNAIESGLDLAAHLMIGSETVNLDLPLGVDSTSGAVVDKPMAPSQPSATSDSTEDGTRWIDIQKSMGPVHFGRIGIQYENAELTLRLDGSLAVGPLSLALNGLGVSTPLHPIDPDFTLDGVALSYEQDPLTIAGALLRRQISVDGEFIDEFNGKALIRTDQFSLSAIGSYANLHGHPSLFVYALLDYPIGGPSFFFVTGVAAGFGFNRDVRTPGISDVKSFPLVRQAISPESSGGSIADSSESIAQRISDELTSFGDWIRPDLGSYFLAAGIRFTSFETIHSFALLLVKFGRRLEIDLLGISSITVPTPEDGKQVPPVAKAELQLKATLLPDDGFLGVEAQLSPASFILSPDCHLTGGFAFYSWFKGEHDGDFVQTLGGYHPDFHVPAHYPSVPRLGFNWKVSDHLNVSGSAYFAMTPSALMAGGALNATWKSGSISAYFKAYVDLLLAWKPYHYDARIGVNMGVKYTYHFLGTHHISVDVGADLHVWGPEFAGIAHIHLWVVSFTVHFGSSTENTLPPISWNEFQQSFLPKRPKSNELDISSVTIQGGLTSTVGSGTEERWVVDPKNLEIASDSVIPLTEAVLSPSEAPLAGAPHDASVGISPMDVQPDRFRSKLHLEVTRDGQHAEGDFRFEPSLKAVPAALWGTDFRAQLNGARTIPDTLAGFRIRPANQPVPGETQAVDRRELAFSTHGLDDVFDWEGSVEFVPAASEPGSYREALDTALADGEVAKHRASLLKELVGAGAADSILIDHSLVDALLNVPELGTFSIADS